MKRPFRLLTRTLLSTILLKKGRSRQNNHTISLCFAKCCVSHIPGKISQKWLREALYHMEQCMPDKCTLTWVVCCSGSLLLFIFNPVSLRLQEVIVTQRESAWRRNRGYFLLPWYTFPCSREGTYLLSRPFQGRPHHKARHFLACTMRITFLAPQECSGIGQKGC